MMGIGALRRDLESSPALAASEDMGRDGQEEGSYQTSNLPVP